MEVKTVVGPNCIWLFPTTRLLCPGHLLGMARIMTCFTR